MCWSVFRIRSLLRTLCVSTDQTKTPKAERCGISSDRHCSELYLGRFVHLRGLVINAGNRIGGSSSLPAPCLPHLCRLPRAPHPGSCTFAAYRVHRTLLPAPLHP
jgi:hypothetical protein